MTALQPSKDEENEIIEYYERFHNMPANQILEHIQQLNEFFIKHMTKEGKKRFFQERGIKLL